MAVMSWISNFLTGNKIDTRPYSEAKFSFEYPAYFSMKLEGGATIAFYNADEVKGVLRFTRILPGENYTAEKLILSQTQRLKAEKISAKKIREGDHKGIYWKETKTFLEDDYPYWPIGLVRERERAMREKEVGFSWYVQASAFYDMRMHYWCLDAGNIFMFWSYRTFVSEEKSREVQKEFNDIKEIFRTIKIT